MQNLYNLTQTNTTEQLQSLTESYPFFSLGHYVYAAQLHSTQNLPDATLEKTLLHVNNPVWLHYLLNNNSTTANKKTTNWATAEQLEELFEQQKTDINKAVVKEEIISTADNIEKQNEIPLSNFEFKSVDEQKAFNTEKSEAPILNENISADILEPPINPTISNDNIQSATAENFNNAVIETINITKTEAPNAIEAATLAAEFTEVKTKAQIEPTLPSKFISDPDLLAVNDTESAEVATLQQPELSIEEKTSETAVNPPNQNEAVFTTPKLSSVLNQPLSPEEVLNFEPAHLVDYFASQGIKLSEDMLGRDKLGRQLKGFNAWLKTMKKIHPEKLINTSFAQDVKVQNLANLSNQEKAILTEAMAEVLVKQGLSAKAIEIYQKLSLLDPAKSAYFAAKIDAIK
jgi:hypothetical protein